MATSDYERLLLGDVDNTEEDNVASPGSFETSLNDYERLLNTEVDPTPSVESTEAPVRLEPKARPEADVVEQLGSIYRRTGQSILQGTADVARGAALSREFTDDPELFVDRDLDWIHMTPVEQAEAGKRFLGQDEEVIRQLRIQTHIAKREEFIAAGEKFAAWMPEVEGKRTTGALSVVDDIATGVSRFLPTMVGGALSGGSLAFPLAYMQLLPGKYEGYIKDNVEPERAFATAQGAAVALALVEGLSANIVLGKMAQVMGKKYLGKGLTKFIDALVIPGTSEGFEELTQGELEVIFDVHAKNPDATPEEKVAKVIGIWKDPTFQKQKLYEAAIGVGGGMTMGAGAVATARIKNGPGSKAAVDQIPDGDGNKMEDVPTGQDGVQIVTPDTRAETDVKSEAETVSSVESMLGIVNETQPGEDGVSINSDLTVTDEQRTAMHQNTDASNNVISNSVLDDTIQQTNVELETAEAKLQNLVGFYNNAVEADDAEAALQTANMMAQETENIVSGYGKMLNLAAERHKANSTIMPENNTTEVKAVVDRLQAEAKERITAQTTAVRQIQLEAQQNIIDKMDTDEGLQAELIGASVTNTREGNPKQAKLYNNIISEMRYYTAVGNQSYFEKTPMKKLINLRVEAALNDEMIKGDPQKGDTMTLARNQAVIQWLDKMIINRGEHDQVQLLGDRISHDAAMAKKEAAKKAATATAAPAVKAVERRKKNVATGQKVKEQRRLAGVADKAKKGGRTVTDQSKKIREQVAGPTRTTELKEAKEDKAKRVAAVERQVQGNKDLADTPVSRAKQILPKGVEFDGIGDGQTAMPKGHVAATIKDKKRMAHGSSIVVDPNKPVKPQLNEKEVQFTTYENLSRPDTSWTILTSDNPKSTTASVGANTKARALLKQKLDAKEIPYRIGKSKFGKGSEMPFVIPHMTRADAKKLSDDLGQASFIVAEGDKVHFIEGGDVTTIDKSDMRKAKPGEDYTEIGGTKFHMPFSESGDSLLDTEAMQMAEGVATKAKSLFKAAAIRLNGKVYEGATHLSAIQENPGLEADLMRIELRGAKLDSGFVTHDGAFVSRAKATEMVGKQKKELFSEDFLGEFAQNRLDESGVNVVDFDKMPLADQMGTLEAVDALKKKMKDGKYKDLFAKTEKAGVTTIFITQPGQFAKMEQVQRKMGNAAAIANAAKRFDGDTQINPKTGKMQPSGGLLGLYIESQKVAIINLPLINKSAQTLDKAFETVVHEHVHALIRDGAKNLSPVEVHAYLDELNKLWDGIDPEWVKAQFNDPTVHPRVKAGIHQVSKNVNELVTYSLAHPEFAAWLDQIPASLRFKAKSNKIKSVWDSLKDLIIKKVLKMPSKYDELMVVLNNNLKFAEKQVRFSKEETSFDFGANVTPDNMTEWSDELAGLAVNALPVTVVQSTQEASDALGMKIESDVQGVWTSDGDLVMVADNIDSKETFIKKWLHEQVGHHGLREIFGKHVAAFNRFLNQSFTLFLIKDPKSVQDMADLHDIWYETDKKGKPVLTKFKKADKLFITEEVIARRAETLNPVAKRGIIKRFREFIQRWLPSKFVGELDTFKLTDDDIMNVLRAARENVLTGSTKFNDLLGKAMDKRRPTVKSGTKSTEKFMETDETYLSWADEVVKVAPNLQKWYSEHVEMITKHFGKDNQLFSVLLAVTSPQADVETNVQFAIDTYAYMLGLRDKPGALFPNKLKDRIDNNWKTPDEMLADLESKNFKVTEFARALLGDPTATVGDMWMYRAFFGDPLSFGKDAETFSIPQITSLRQKLHSLAAQMSERTGKPWTAREMQAAIWVHINAKQTGKDIAEVATYKSGLNRPSVKYDGKTPLGWLQSIVPNLSDGLLSDAIGIENIPIAPVSPLQKKLIHQESKGVKGKYPVSTKGVIKVMQPGVTNIDVIKMVNAIVAGGREVTAKNDEFAKWYQKVFGFEVLDDGLHMKLSDQAVELYTNEKGIIKFNTVRDNLSGFSGNYTQAVRFSKKAKDTMDEMAQADSTVDDHALLTSKSNDPKKSFIGKLHMWRDQAELNINRFIAQTEQEFLEKFGGRKSRIIGVGTGRYLHTAKSEVMAKAMNLYVDSGQDAAKLAKVTAFRKGLLRKKRMTVAETEKLKIIDTMLNMSAGAKGWANDNVKPQYDQWFQFAQKHGIIESYVEDYVKRSWAMPEEYKNAGITWDGTGATGFKTTTSSGKKRSFTSIIDGWEVGMELKTEGVLGNLQNYANEIGYVFANRRFTDYLKSMVTNKPEAVIAIRDNEQKPPEGMTRVHLRGLAAPGKVVYAREDIGKELNRLGQKASAIWETKGMVFTRKMNSVMKSTLLSVSMFHHLAGMRSYVYGVKGAKGLNKIRAFKAYREGLRKMDEKEGFDSPNYQHLGPIVDLLVGQGLTIGKVQDWEEQSMFQSWIEEALRKSSLPGAEMALHGWQGMRRTKRQWTNGLFGQLFAGLKAQSAAIELTREIGVKEKEFGRGLTDTEINVEAEKVARLINADFGGLHLKRMGRHPDYQMAAQLVLLAPDWTESNWRTVTGMVPGVNNKIDDLMGGNIGPEGMSKVYRKFWMGIAWKGAATVALAQWAVLALFGDDDDRDEYKKQMGEFFTREGFAKGRWASVDVTPVLDALGMAPVSGKRQDLNVLGHFKDILKVATPVTLAVHKLSPVVGTVEAMATATDWKGDRFKSIEEIMNATDWSLTADKYKDPRDAEGTMAAVQQRIVAGIYAIRKAFPIPLNEVMQGIQGESSWVTAMARGGGVDIRDVRHKDPNETFYWKKSQEVKRLERNLNEAKEIRDSGMIYEARKDIRDYDNFNRTKSRLGFARTRLGKINKKIRGLETKIDRGIESSSDLSRLQDLKRRKAEIYKRFFEVLER